MLSLIATWEIKVKNYFSIERVWCFEEELLFWYKISDKASVLDLDIELQFFNEMDWIYIENPQS